ncbi:MAG: ribosome biogenesis GTPase Der [Candidatus Improbicoccus devescovinae]|nr:MAG: ribosome biogenesis GTPase Der [Candidatus Improbicoccus devescovinae]
MSMPKVMLVGRTNVGKSALFNRLIGKRVSIVYDALGVTRDCVRMPCRWNSQEIMLIDSAGLNFDLYKQTDTSCLNILNSQMGDHTFSFLNSADIIVFVTNVHDSILNLDKKIAFELKKLSKPIILCVNKCDSGVPIGFYEFYSLGFGKPIPVSALHGNGTGDLLDAIFSECKTLGISCALENISDKITETKPETNPETNIKLKLNNNHIKVAIVGRPNAGKSSIINNLCGENLTLVSEIAGTTRDASDLHVTRARKNNDQNLIKTNYIFVDTAGIRKHHAKCDHIERYSIMRTEEAIKSSDVCICVIDASEGITKQDVKIAGLSKNYGKSCIILINKWDLIKNPDQAVFEFQEHIQHDFVFMRYLRFLFVSAKKNQKIDKIFSTIDSVFHNREMRISTSVLNNLLSEIMIRTPPPKINNQELKIYYATQVATSPPKFTFFVNKSQLFHFSYQRHIENCLRQVFDFSGTPIRFLVREKAEIRKKINLEVEYKKNVNSHKKTN